MHERKWKIHRVSKKMFSWRSEGLRARERARKYLERKLGRPLAADAEERDTAYEWLFKERLPDG